MPPGQSLVCVIRAEAAEYTLDAFSSSLAKQELSRQLGDVIYAHASYKQV